MKRLVVLLAILLAAASLYADELTPEKKIFGGEWAVERVAIASDGAAYAAVIESVGKISVVRVSADGDPVSAIDINDSIAFTEPQIAFDGVNFVIVVRDPARGFVALWLTPDESIHGPAFIADGDGFSLARAGDGAAIVVRKSLALFGENLLEFRLGRDYTVRAGDAITSPVNPIRHSVAYAGRNRLVGWTESWVNSPGCGITPCGVLEALRFSMTDAASGSTYVSPQWALVPRHELRLVAVPDAFIWFALRYGNGNSPEQIESGVIRLDEAADEPAQGGTILCDAFRGSYEAAFTGTRFLLVGKVSIPDEHSVTGRTIGIEARWVTVDGERRFATSTPFVIDPVVNAYAVGSTGEGRAAVVYSKVQYTNTAVIPLPDVYIRIAGQHEPSRSRAVRR